MQRKSVQIIGWVVLAGTLVVAGIVVYLWFKPHRNVQTAKVFAYLTVEELTHEFTANAAAANAKYLSADGNSKVLIVEGLVSHISLNQAGEKMIILKNENMRVGVSAVFTQTTTASLSGIQKGDRIKVKGAITAGNSYDSSLDLYEHAVLVQCTIVK